MSGLVPGRAQNVGQLLAPPVQASWVRLTGLASLKHCWVAGVQPTCGWYRTRALGEGALMVEPGSVAWALAPTVT